MRARISFLLVVVLALLAGIGATVPASAEVPVAPGVADGITVTVHGDAVLAGATGQVNASVSNPAGVDLFNALAVAVLPVGVAYAPGSISPSSLGEPTILTWIPDPDDPDAENPATAQVLVWSNIADLPIGSDVGLTFGTVADPDLYPAGSSYEVGVGFYASDNERNAPDVTIPDSGPPVISDATEGGDKDATVQVVPVTITKSETANAEAEVYRGPQNPATYAVTVRTAPEGGTAGVVVVDDVPAQFTVTGCTGAFPCTRTTVEVDGEVFTRLAWDLGTVAADTTVKLTYTAYVGEREITMPNGEATGASTRPDGEGYDVSNTAILTGTYAGDVAPGSQADVTVSDSATVRVLDLGVVKTASASDFVGGDTLRYTLNVRTSQYVSTTGITLRDIIPNGMCPVLPAGVQLTGDTWPAECANAAAGTGSVTGATMTAVDFDAATGVFTVDFTLRDLDADQDATVRYSVLMRLNYQDGEPTAVGDGFTNAVTVAGTTHADDEDLSVTNDSAASLGTADVTLAKSIWLNSSRTPITGISGTGSTCQNGEYTQAPSDAPSYQLGDLVCFRIESTFPVGVSTRSVFLTDFLPPGMSMVGWATAPGNTTTVTPMGSTPATATRWALGEETSGTRFVAPGATATIDILARVDSVPATKPRVTGNLAKLRYSTDDNRVVGLRDAVDLQLSPPPPLALDKKVNGADSLTPVREGQSLSFTIDVSHTGTTANSTADPVDEVEVWDVLPAGFDCGDITSASPAITPGSDCTTLPDGSTRVVWNLDLATPLVGGGKTTISYTLSVPTPLSISSTHTNTAAVVRYTPISTDGISAVTGRPTFYPTNPVGAYPDETKNAPEASDQATVGLAPAAVTKAVVSTGVSETNNSADTQATIGETVTWRYTATIPANTSIFNGVLSDGLPVGSRLTVSGAGTPTATASNGATITTGCTADATAFRLCSDAADPQFGSLLFPTIWTNTSAQAVTFTVTLPTRVADVAANTHSSTISNTATLTSTPGTAPTGSVTRGSATAQVGVVVAAPALAKAASVTSATAGWTTADSLVAGGGQTLYYRLTASNTSGRPPVHDTVIVDCIDSRLTNFSNLTSSTVATLGGPVAGDGTNGCATGRTKYTWTLAQDLASSATIIYSATVPNPIAGGVTFRNDAALAGSTVAGVVDGERTLTATANRTVTAAPPTLTKVRVSPTGAAVPGETVTWRLTMKVPAGVLLHEARILDTLGTPLGTAANATFAVSCADDWTGPCPTGSRLAAPSGSPQVLGVYLDDIAAADAARTLYVDVTTVVPTSTAATVLTATNQARISWNTTAGTPPTTAVAGTNSTSNVSATVDLRHPLVTVTKSVSDASTPKAQGEIFIYTVTAGAVQNTSPNGKPAYNVKVVDKVPTGVIPVVSSTDPTPLADNATLAGGGVWNATARTITWTFASLTPGATATSVTYPAKLDLATRLTGAALVNTATPTAWDSLPTDGKTYTSSTGATASVTPAAPKVDATKQQVTANPVYIGDNVTFSLTLTNSGTATAVSLSAVDTLPTGWTYVAGSARLGGSALADPAVSGQRLTWAGLGPLTPAQSATITYQAVAGSGVQVGSTVAHTNAVTAADVTDATGGTSLTGGALPYVGTGDSATARIHQTDLAITKTAGTFTAGGTGSFTIVVTNKGADPAVGASVRDTLTLPTGVSVASVVTTRGTCSLTGSVLDCTNPAPLASGGTWTITVGLSVAADVASGTEVPNTATVSARTEDRTPGNNTATATGRVITSADLAVSKAVTNPASGAVTAGQAIEWSVTLTNFGPSVSRGSAATPIVLTDTLPSTVTGLSITGTAPDGCTLTGRQLRCEIDRDLAVGDTIVVRVAGTVASSVPAGRGAIVNTASVTPVTTDPATPNNSSTTTTDVVVREALTIVKAITDPAPPAEVTPGDQLTYTLRVSNGGPSDARGVFIVDALPEGLTFGSIVGAANGWTATANADHTVTFTYAGTLAAGADAPLITYTAKLGAHVTGDPADLENVATVSSAWKANQDSSSAIPGVPNPEADLALDKSVRPTGGEAGDSVVAGKTAVYTITVDNRGPSDAGTVTVTDVLPVGLSVDGDLPEQCEADGRRITCVLADGLDADDDPWTFSFTVLVDPSFDGTSVDNTATVTSVTDDPDTGNNADTATLDIISRATLRVTKTPSAETVTAGDTVTWTIVVDNDGPSDARDVLLTDVLEPGLEFVSAGSSTSGVTCAEDAATCSLGTIAAGETVRISVVTRVRSSVVDGTTIPNEATATSSTIDPSTGDPATATGGDEIATIARSELTISKTATTPTVSAGEVAIFRIAVGNDGPSDAAAAVKVTDTLPDGATFISSSTIGGPAQWACEDGGDDVVCTLRDADGDPVTLAAGTDAPVLQISAVLDAALPAGKVTNTAKATSPSDPTPPSDTADVDVVTFADLGITKTAVGTPTAGEEFAWTITVTNHGPSDSVASATDPILITDELPTGVTFVSGSGAACSDEDDTVTCELRSTLAAGDSVAVTLRVAVDEAASGVISNTATVTPSLTDEPDGATHPNEATNVTEPVIEEADLAIAKAVTTDAGDIVAGQPIAWQLTVTNLGPSNSDADADHPIVVTDTLPEGVTAQSASGQGWDCAVSQDQKTVTCTLDSDLATGDPQTITVQAMIDPDTRGDVTNTAAVAPGLTAQPADSADNDEATATSTVLESADLRLVKDISGEVVAGATGRYLIQVFNGGPSTARDVTVTDRLPEILTFERVVTPEGEASPWTCAPSSGDPQVIECTYDGSIVPGPEAVTLEIEMSAAADLTGDVTNTATVTSSTPDPDPANNTDGVDGTLVTSADLVVAKSHDPELPAVAGEEFTWTVTVTNDGPSDSVASEASPITVTDRLEDGTTFVPDRSSDACSVDPADPQLVVCLIEQTIPAGGSASVDVRVALDEALAGELSNSATATPGDTADPDLANNTGTDTVPVAEVADLAVEKGVVTAADDVVAGHQIEWEVHVINRGPSNSDASPDDPIRVVDTLPSGVSFVSAEGTGWACAAGEVVDGRETVECLLTSDLPVGRAPVITIVGLIDPGVQDSVRNEVEVWPGLTPEPDGSRDGNTDHANAPVGESADLLLTKAVAETINAGSGGRYALTVTNLGPSTARGVEIVDTLPDGLTFAAATGDGWECAADGQEVECSYAEVLAPAASLTLLIDVTADESLTGDIVNTATVSATTPDPDPDNNTGTATGTVAERVDLSIVKTATGRPVVGETFAYELAVRNAGPAMARGVLVSDLLPASLAAVSAEGEGWSCGLDSSTGAVSCALPELAAGQSAPVITVLVRVLPAAYPTVANTASVSSTTPEDAATLADNSSTATVEVPALSALAITKELTGGLITGKTAHYVVTVTNQGPTPDPGPVTVTDPMPDGLVARSAELTGADGSCEVDADEVTCLVDGLEVGQTVTVDLTVYVSADASGDIINVATATSDASDDVVEASAEGTVTVVRLPNAGGGQGVSFGVGLLALVGLIALAGARRHRDEA
ncbi:DUF11 domain-containing protein [Tessaracoccus palaemonis]|uniref:DUF11 domain-containing protein n=1 Tax=Tessaracoccus palaemonis TaxID=2829499 RepID=A0ABX8SGV8_9ACTN|nr:DUF11 domain-containing protein [Tessaracoccus palaemonis]QXT62510.1 DUF11 domain-containing protein [Tessaracoccus palaemonis]